MRRESVTLSDVARHTGFSKNTISRYFNRPDTLTPKNRMIIEKALQELGYTENKVARVLANGKTEFIGVIVPNLNLQFYAEILSRMLEMYEQYGYKFMVFTANGQYETEKRYISELLAYKIEGLIVLSHTVPSYELAALNLPVVAIEREDEHLYSVRTDNVSGGHCAAEMLQTCGCDVLIHINSLVKPHTPAYGRIVGFEAYCKSHKLPYEICRIDWKETFAENKRIMQQLLRDLATKYPHQKKGLFVSNDNNAATLLNLILTEHGGLADHWRIVGFDNSAASQEAILPISTIGQQLDVIAAATMELIDLQIRQRREGTAPTPPEHRIIPVEPICRETTN